MIGGVCSGLGRSTGIDPVVFRVVVAVLAVTGAGLLLYVGAWLVLPAEGDEVSPAEALLGRGTSSMNPATTILLGLLGVLGLLWIAGAHGTGGVLLAAAIVGAVLLLRRNGHSTAWPHPPAAGGPAPVPVAPYAPHGPFGATGATGAPSTGATGAPSTGRYSAPFQAQQPEPAYPAQRPEPPLQAQRPEPAYPAQRPEPPYPAPLEPPFPSYGAWQPPPVATQPLPPMRRKQRQVLGLVTFVLAALGAGVLIAVDRLGWAHVAPATVLALPLAILGLGLLLSTLFGRARALIVVGLVLTVAVVAVRVAGLSSWSALDRQIGNQTLRPASLAAVDGTYRGGIGNTTLDLSRVHFPDSATRVAVDGGVGDITITVPATVDVTIDAHRRLGNVTVFGDQASARNGLRRTDNGADGPGGGRLDLTINGGIGNVEVNRASA